MKRVTRVTRSEMGENGEKGERVKKVKRDEKGERVNNGAENRNGKHCATTFQNTIEKCGKS